MKKILLIDDNINFLKPLSNLLQKNFDVYMATGVKEAIQILESIHIDMICSDYFMGDGTGLDIIKKVNSLNICIPFIILSGLEDPELIQEVESCHAIFLNKTNPELLSKLYTIGYSE